MILRVFRAKNRKGCVADFQRMVIEQSIPWLEGSEGLLEYFPGKPLEASSREFVMFTIWRDIESLEKFSGSNWQNPVVTEDESPLVEEMYAHHYIQFGKESTVINDQGP